ncbi:hypothetical protein [Sulfurospirillum oryzae]|uniref:hypothetical protein n=1 Tax=Sulfurospirillum oryzae TaxID=2976535 RepID=UPI0021E93600|nr:hypothetical protein [Sulfurospirillum oryzae]
MFEKAKYLKSYGIKTPFLQELIWFHRINDDQDKELLTLEFLNVCANHAKEGRLFDKELTTVNYRKDIQLRTILYNFPELESIHKTPGDDAIKWEHIISCLQNKLEKPFDYSYLRKRFDSIETFVFSVLLLRKASLGISTSRRWTSKFLFPFSFDTLFVDIDNRKETFSMDRRFFSRGGEVLYLMVSRGKNIDELKTYMKRIFENPSQNKRWNALTTAFRSEEETVKEPVRLGFLQLNSHEIYDQLVDDLITLFKSNIPNNDLFYHFASIASFYMVHFILTVAAQNLKSSLIQNEIHKVVYPIELLAPRSDHVRRASRQIYKINEELPLKILELVLTNYFQEIANVDDKDILLKMLDNDLNYVNEDNQYTADINLDELFKHIWNTISQKAKNDLLPIHRVLLKGAGLASAKKTNSYRYLANDEWLKTLVLINVSERIPFHQFIDILYEKYGFIISNKHSSLLIEAYSDNDFKKNELRLFERLRALGLLESKSDGYAYVLNRHGRNLSE